MRLPRILVLIICYLAQFRTNLGDCVTSWPGAFKKAGYISTGMGKVYHPGPCCPLILAARTLKRQLVTPGHTIARALLRAACCPRLGEKQAEIPGPTLLSQATRRRTMARSPGRSAGPHTTTRPTSLAPSPAPRTRHSRTGCPPTSPSSGFRCSRQTGPSRLRHFLWPAQPQAPFRVLACASFLS